MTSSTLNAAVAVLIAFLVPRCDPDLDGVATNRDNCPVVANAEQNDLDGDGVGDRCDPPLDGVIVWVDTAEPVAGDVLVRVLSPATGTVEVRGGLFVSEALIEAGEELEMLIPTAGAPLNDLVVHVTAEDGRRSPAARFPVISVAERERSALISVRDGETDLPLAGAEVRVAGLSFLTDVDGFVETGPTLPLGRQLLVITAGGYAPSIEQLAPEADPGMVDVSLNPALDVRATGPAGGSLLLPNGAGAIFPPGAIPTGTTMRIAPMEPNGVIEFLLGPPQFDVFPSVDLNAPATIRLRLPQPAPPGLPVELVGFDATSGRTESINAQVDQTGEFAQFETMTIRGLAATPKKWCRIEQLIGNVERTETDIAADCMGGDRELTWQECDVPFSQSTGVHAKRCLGFRLLLERGFRGRFVQYEFDAILVERCVTSTSDEFERVLDAFVNVSGEADVIDTGADECCDDGIQNGPETDVDCGGPEDDLLPCQRCLPNETCGNDDDCVGDTICCQSHPLQTQPTCEIGTTIFNGPSPDIAFDPRQVCNVCFAGCGLSLQPPARFVPLGQSNPGNLCAGDSFVEMVPGQILDRCEQ